MKGLTGFLLVRVPGLQPAAEMSLAEYIAALPPSKRDALTEGIEPETVSGGSCF